MLETNFQRPPVTQGYHNNHFSNYTNNSLRVAFFLFFCSKTGITLLYSFRTLDCCVAFLLVSYIRAAAYAGNTTHHGCQPSSEEYALVWYVLDLQSTEGSGQD